MSFVTSKNMKCFFCSREQSICEINFPEDLFDLVTLYKISQLFWLCETCKNISEENPSSLTPLLVDKSKETNTVNLKVNNLMKYTKSPVLGNIQCGQYNSKHEELKDDFDTGKDVLLHDLKRVSLSGTSKPKCKSHKFTQAVLTAINVNQNEQKVNKKIVLSVLYSLEKMLKENEEFSYLYSNKRIYTGSAFNDLRIKDALEYDIDLVLKLPPKIIQLTPEFSDGLYSYAKLKWEVIKEDNSKLAVEFLESNSADGYLQPKKVLSWFQRHLDIIKEKFILPENVKSVKFIQSGPARTVVIETTTGYAISVDLVPVFEFQYSSLEGLPMYSEVIKTAEGNDNDIWLLVPKEMSEETELPSSQIKLYWRLDFPYAEKNILAGKGTAKSVIKILKNLRDEYDWKALASYYLKMVVLLAIIEQPGADYWKNENLFDILIDSLKQLANCLEKKTMLHFLTKQNLLSKLNTEQCKNWRNRLNNFISQLEQSPDTLLTFLKVSE